MSLSPGYRILAILGEAVGATARGQNTFAEGVPARGAPSAIDGQYRTAARREAVERMAAYARAHAQRSGLPVLSGRRQARQDRRGS